MKRAAVFVLGLVGLLALPGCATRADDDRPTRRITELAQPGPELSQELMLGLALARNYHHKADVYLKEARIDDAVISVRQILSIPFPADSAEGEDIRLDACARLAKLLAGRGELDQAMTVVDEGLARVSRQSFFAANLHTVRGQLLEARAVSIEDRDKAAASAARRQAIEAHDRAIAIEKALIGQLAGEEVE
jgi:hypothetical protein